MTDVVVTDQAFGGVDRERALAERFALSFAEHQLRDEGETVEAVRGARLVFDNFAPITEPVLAGLGEGAVVIRYGVGYDNVDVEAARRLGVRVANVPDYGVSTVADHTVALLLALLRKVGRFDREIRTGGWLAPGDLGRLPGLEETIVGLVGSGRIGAAVIERLRVFGVTCRVHDPFVRPEQIAALGGVASSLEEVLGESHAISLHVPLTPATRHLIDAAAFASMQKGAYLVNTARGGLVDEAALIDALSAGRLGAAALDVFEHEPLPADSPLLDRDDVLLTPHAAFFSDSSLDALQRLAAEEGERALSGAPLRCEVT